jgi:hypothetical protein
VLSQLLTQSIAVSSLAQPKRSNLRCGLGHQMLVEQVRYQVDTTAVDIYSSIVSKLVHVTLNLAASSGRSENQQRNERSRKQKHELFHPLLPYVP